MRGVARALALLSSASSGFAIRERVLRTMSRFELHNFDCADNQVSGHQGWINLGDPPQKQLDGDEERYEQRGHRCEFSR
jgi:hypothetical protein